jgi:hypothetical protein
MLDKTQVLLKAWEMQDDGLRRAAEREQRIFQWSTSLLIATFGAVVTLSSSVDQIQFPNPVVTKILITTVIVVPVTASIIWILRRAQRAVCF